MSKFARFRDELLVGAAINRSPQEDYRCPSRWLQNIGANLAWVEGGLTRHWDTRDGVLMEETSVDSHMLLCKLINYAYF